MFSFGKSKRVVNIVIDDYIIRMVENNGKDFASIKNSAEKTLPANTIENGKIIDELKFFDFLKDVVQEWGIKNRQVRFYVPHELIIMREIDLPEKVKKSELKQYITLEIGNTIHFPFKNPVFDLYDTSKAENENKITVLAAPEEEIIKYTEIFADVKLEPIAVDVQPLGIYRYYLTETNGMNIDKVNLFLELNLTSSNISIFHQHKLEFLRYQSLNVMIQDWQPDETDNGVRWTFTGDETNLQGEIEDHLNELDRLMNFYRFSIHQGERAVTDIILLGDYPRLEDVKARIQNRYNLPVTILTAKANENEQLSSVYIPALGLALKGAK